MKRLHKVLGTLAVTSLGLSAAEIPFHNVENWMALQSMRSAGSITALEKAALIHTIGRGEFKEGQKQERLGKANFAESQALLRSLNTQRGDVVDSTIGPDEIHYYYYKTNQAASVRSTLAWLDQENANLDIRIRRSGAFIRPWSQNSDGTITRSQNDTKSSVERVDTEIKAAEEFVVSVTMRDKKDTPVPYTLLVSGGEFSERQLRLKTNLLRAKSRAEEKRTRVQEYVDKTGAPIDTTLEDGTFRSLIDIVNGEPVYYQTFNHIAAKSSSTDKVWSGGGLGYDLDGSTLPRSIGIWDGGTVLTSHVEFEGRVKKGDNGEVGNHGTHVAGTMVAVGKDPKAKGMASKATMISYKWDSDEYEMNNEAQKGLAISQHSYGIPGNVGYSSAWDEIANDNPFYVISKSAGNDSNYKTVSLNGNSKNILTIGSAVDQPNGWQGPNIAKSSFSSEGPAPDYRIKPEIMANGSGLWSCNSQGGYENMSGTSMAGPAHAGSVALIHEHWYNTHGNTIMRSATMRALVCNTADEMGSEGPSYATGFGYLNTATAVELITANDGGSGELIQELSLSDGQDTTIQAKHVGSDAIAITIAWNDPASSISGSGSTPRLINDLDLRVVVDGTEYLPWAMNSSTNECYKGDNKLDNIEKVQIDGTAGKNVEVIISHKGSLQGATQNYSLVMSGVEVNSEPYVRVSTPNGDEEFEQFTTETIKWRSNVDEPVNIILFKAGSAVDTIAKSTVNSGSYEWEIPEDLTVGDDYTIAVECITTTSLKDESDEKFSIVPEYIITEFPWFEPFEEYTKGEVAVGKWTQDEKNDELDWLVFSGVTPTGQFGIDKNEDPGTGPLGDHTDGNGNYIYMEATENYQDNKSCIITSPKLNLEAVAAPKLSYWLQMNSKDGKMGDIALDIIVDGEENEDVKTYSGDKGLEWFSDTVDMTPYVGKRVQLRFHATVGDSFYSDICIDDIKLEGSLLPSFKDLKDISGKEGVGISEKITIENGVDDMEFSIDSDHGWLVVDKNSSSQITLAGTPKEGDAGESTVVVSLKAMGATVTDSFNITIKENSKPVFTSDDKKKSVSKEEFSFDISLEDDDSENELTIAASDLPDWISFEDFGDGEATLTGTPSDDDTGTYKLTLEGSDGVAKEKTIQKLTLTIEPGEGILDGVTLIERDIVAIPNVIAGGEKTDIALTIDSIDEVTLYVFDHLGNLLKKRSTQVKKDFPYHGLQQCGNWDGTNSNGVPVASGSYSAVIKVVDFKGVTSWYRTYVGVQR